MYLISWLLSLPFPPSIHPGYFIHIILPAIINLPFFSSRKTKDSYLCCICFKCQEYIKYAAFFFFSIKVGGTCNFSVLLFVVCFLTTLSHLGANEKLRLNALYYSVCKSSILMMLYLSLLTFLDTSN